MLAFNRLLMVAALCTVCFDTSTRWFLVAAQDSPEEVATDGGVEEASEAKSGEEKTEEVAGEASGEENEEKAQAFMDSAQDLQDKLDQLNALLEAKGDTIDPELKERIQGLKNQLTGLGLDGLGANSPGANKELSEFLQQCLILTVSRVGRKSSTINTLAKFSEESFTREQAAQSEFWRMAITCIQEVNQDDLDLMKKGELKKLPKEFADIAKKEGEKKVMDLDDQLWQELKYVVPSLVKAYTGNTNSEDNRLPVEYGLLALIPFGIMALFLGKLYVDMKKKQSEEEDRKAKKQEKKKSK